MILLSHDCHIGSGDSTILGQTVLILIAHSHTPAL